VPLGLTDMRRTLKYFLCAVVTASFGFIGCSDNPPTWSQTSKAPSGGWVAYAYTREFSGFGTGAIETHIEVKPDRAMYGVGGQVAQFNNASGKSLELKLQWSRPNRLHILYIESSNRLVFSRTRMDGVEVIFHNLAYGPISLPLR
jgi:hypothetical protein